MKKKVNWLYGLLLLVVIVSCKKKNENPADPTPEKDIPGAVRTKHGEVVGTSTKQIIGADGGSLEIPNRGVKLSVPAGALETNIEFSIQEVEYLLPFGAIGKAYRFLPENVTFKKDIEITIPFGQLSNTSSKALSLAYQDNKGYWHMVKQPIVDEYKNTVTAKTRHFSDWGVVSTLYINNSGKEELSAGETTKLEIKFIPTKESPDNDDLLDIVVTLADTKVKKWYASATGAVISGGLTTSVTYKAPESINTMGSTSIFAVVFVDGREITLACSLMLLPEQYCALKIASNYLTFDDIDVLSAQDMFINFYGNYKEYRFHLEAPDHNVGKKPFGRDKALVSTYINGKDYYTSAYTQCDGPELYYTDGEIVVTEVKNGLVNGTASGVLRLKTSGTSYCFGGEISFSAKFRYKKP
ncbi:hypothetical protein [Pedobacter sp.]|uniref:hypothetical protein n=1 Tax=Pedobacter sp. TaxID=1411316 RepID=UPI0031D7108A